MRAPIRLINCIWSQRRRRWCGFGKTRLGSFGILTNQVCNLRPFVMGPNCTDYFALTYRLASGDSFDFINLKIGKRKDEIGSIWLPADGRPWIPEYCKCIVEIFEFREEARQAVGTYAWPKLFSLTRQGAGMNNFKLDTEGPVAKSYRTACPPAPSFHPWENRQKQSCKFAISLP